MSNNLEQQNDSLDITISYGKSVTSNKLQPTSLREVLHTIKTGGNGIKESVEEICACPDSEQRQTLKKQNLPYFNLGQFRDNIRKDANFEQTQHFLFDCDHLGEKIVTLKEQLRQDPTVFAAFVSPSGDGLKVMYRLSAAITSESEYRKLYAHYSEEFTRMYGYDLDHTTDPSRACFLPYDPDLHKNEDATPLATNIPTNGQVRKPSVVKAAAIVTTDPLAALLSNGVAAGHRTPTATEILGHCIKRGFAEAVALEMLKMWNRKNIKPLADDKIAYT